MGNSTEELTSAICHDGSGALLASAALLWQLRADPRELLGSPER